MNSKALAAIMAAFLISITPYIVAQQQRGSISGTVTAGDETETVEATAVLQTPTGLTFVYSLSCPDSFRFNSLLSGKYKLEFSAFGYQSVTFESLILAPGEKLQVDVTLNKGSFEETIFINSRYEGISGRETTLEDRISPEQMRLLPTPRFLSDLAGLAATNVGGDTYSSSNIGASASASSYHVDGIDVSDPATGRMWVYPNIESISQVELQPVLGSPAETGGFTGMVVNMITKSGGSEWSGEVAGYWFDDSMITWNTDDPGLRRNVLRETFNSEASASIGGPLLKEKLWLYGNIGLRNRDLGFGDRTVPYRYRNTLWKADWYHSEQLTLGVMLHYSHFYRNGRGAAFNVAPEATHKQQGPNRSGSIDLTWIPDQDTIVTVAAHGWDGFFTLEGRGQGPRLYDADEDYYYNNAAGDYKTDRDRYNAKLHATKFVEAIGEHEIKAGIEWQRGQQQTVSRFDTIELSGGEYAYRTIWEPDLYTRNRVQGYTVFFQDSWQPNRRVTVNAGVRYQNLDYNIPDQLTPSGETIQGLGTIHTFASVDPRFSLVWNIDETGQTVLRASAGRYHESVLTYLLDELTPSNAQRNEYTWTGAGWRHVFSSSLASPENYSIDSNLAPMYSDAITLGIEHLTSFGVNLSLDYIHRQDRNQVAARADGIVWTPVTIAVDGRNFEVFSRSGGNPSYTFFNSSQLYTDYDALILRAEKRFGASWQLMASLTFSRLFGNAESKQGITADTVTGELDYHLDPNNQINAEGLMHAHRPWNFKTNATYVFSNGFAISGIVKWIAGAPWTPQIRLSDPALGQQRVTILAEEKSSHRLEAGFTADLRITYGFRFQDLNGSLFADVYNLMNADTATQVDVRLDSPGFGSAINVLQGRRFQVGFRLGF